jgi:hypothetical protein
MRRLLATLALLAAAGAGQAGNGRLVDVRLYDATDGRELPLYRDGGRMFVPGTPGNRYRVVLENRTGERLLAVLSVDGVNAVTGQTASPAQSGYVLGPWERTEIRGWRKSMQESAEFYFTELPDSYAARTGRPDRAGSAGPVARSRRREGAGRIARLRCRRSRRRRQAPCAGRARAGTRHRAWRAPLGSGFQHPLRAAQQPSGRSRRAVLRQRAGADRARRHAAAAPPPS